MDGYCWCNECELSDECWGKTQEGYPDTCCPRCPCWDRCRQTNDSEDDLE